MGYILQLWKVPKTGKNRGRRIFFKKATYDTGIVPQIGQVLTVVGKNGNETRYRISNIEHSVYTVPKERYNETGTEYYARVFIERL